VHHAFKLEDREINVELSRARSGYRLHVGDRVVPVTLHTEDDGSSILTVAGHSERIVVATRGDEVFVHLDGEAFQLRYRHPLDRLAASLHGSAEDSIRAPMPGSIVALQVKAGDAVAKGQVLLVMESMKMETTLTAARDGVVAQVHFAPGQTFDRDAVLVTLEAKP